MLLGRSLYLKVSHLWLVFVHMTVGLLILGLVGGRFTETLAIQLCISRYEI